MPRCVTCGQRWEGTHAHCPRGATPTDAPTGERGRTDPSLAIAGYLVEEVVARGGFGIVYSARREQDDMPVAIKVAHPEVPLARLQLAQEAKVLRAIGPPTVPNVHESGTLPDGVPYLIMQYIARPTLAQRLAQLCGPMPLDEFTPRAQALLDALRVVHGHGYLHGDLKPENVFLDDATHSAGFFDFGLARTACAPTVSSTEEPTPPLGDSFVGTVEYMSPEQCSSHPSLDVRSDIYSLGVLFYEMLTGRPPFFGVPSDVIHAHLARRPLRPSELTSVPAAIEQVVLRCLAKERERRYDNVALLGSALQEALASTQKLPTPVLPPLARPPDKTGPTPPTPVRRSVAVLFFRSGANPVTVQKVLASFGGHMAFHEGTRFAGAFDPDVGENPVQRARQAAEGLAAQNLAPAALVDVATVTVQRRPGGPARYLGPIFSRKDRYPADDDPSTLLFTTAAAEALPDLRWEPLPDRDGILRRATTHTGREDVTILQHGSGVLVGRGNELTELMQSANLALEEVAPTLVTVLGDRGHGKTHLSTALVQQLQEALPHAKVATWRAREPVQGDAEGTLRMLLRGAMYGFIDDSKLTGSELEGRATCFELLGPQLATELWPGVASTLGWLAPGAAELQNWAAAPGALRSLAMRAAGELLVARSRRQPLCLILDDAHYAEETALDALEYAALAEFHIPLWVCVLARPGFERLRPSWGTRAARHHALTLGPLPPSSAVELCRTLLRPAENVPAAALERLSERAQCVPLFLVELVRGLKRQGLVRQRAHGGSWYLATDELERMPEMRLVDWLADRELGALPMELAAHARLCALLGPDFTAAEAEGVVHALEEDGGAADFPLDPRHATRRLLDLGLLVSHRHQEGISFRNELLRATVERALPEADRVRIHRAAFRYYLSDAGAAARQRLPRLTLHAAAAGLRDEAAALYIDLAESARGRHAYIEAESTYTRALELLDAEDRRRRFTVLRGRGLMRYRVGRYEDSLADFAAARELARQLGALSDEVDLLLDEAMAYDWINDYARSEERVSAAQDLTFSSKLQSPLLQVRLLLGLGRTQFRNGQWEECCTPLQEAAERARKLGDAGYESRVVAQLLLGVILPNLGRMDEAERLFEEVITACTERGDRLHLGSAICNRRNLWVARNNFEGAMQDQERFMHLGRELGMVGWEYFAEHNMGELLYQVGEPEAAAPHIARAIELERHHPEMAHRPWALLLQARTLAYTGHDERARELLTEIRRTLKQSGAEFTPSEEVLFSAVELLTRDASPEEWDALLARSSEVSVEQEPLEVLELRGLAWMRRGERAAAVRILEEALRRAETVPNIMRGRLLHSLELARLSPAA